MNINLKKSMALILLIASALLAGFLMLKGSGIYPNPQYRDIFLFAALIAIFSSSKKSFYFIFLPIGILFAFYAPTGLNFGKPNYSYLMSLLATDLMESKEFLQQIPISSFIAAFAIPILLLIYRQLSQKCGLFLHKNKTFLCATLVLALWNQAPFQFLHSGFNAIREVKNEMAKLNNFKIIPAWGESQLTAQSHYDDYILIIGESARRDYHHVYGYPIENTPFIEQSRATVVEGLTSAGTNTVSSLRLMLTKPNTETWQPDYNLNFIDLMNSVGMVTYWLSNQGQMGEFDTPVSVIANRSQYRFFLKKGDYMHSGNQSDMALLPKFSEILKTPSTQKRFIVLHLYGSHPLACERLASDNYPTIFSQDEIEQKYQYINCYISTIKKTDDFIHRVYEQLQHNENLNGRKFSLIYFSDHGMAHNYGKEITLGNNYASKLHHNIPLFKLASDDQQYQLVKSMKSGLNFTDALGHWVGISNSQLNPQADLFNGKNDPTDYGLQQRINALEHPIDPAIDIRPKH